MSLNHNKKVVVGLSGGVDSSVAAYLLLEKGYEVIGVYMRNWHDETNTKHHECPWLEDSNDALLVAQALAIPFHVVDLSVQYHERIVQYMFRTYAEGKTPNPDVLCNREIKFDAFLNFAKQLGANFVATGHYARVRYEDGHYHLLAGKDPQKDQSYFLCQLNQHQLSKAIFPIGDLQKKEVRAIAQKIGLVTAQKKDSQGLCFVGKIHLPDFLKQQLQPKAGEVILIEDKLPIFDRPFTTYQDAAKPYAYTKKIGRVIGKHEGAHYYTIGQRKGLKIGGFQHPLFVLATDVRENIVYVGETENHQGLYHRVVRLNKMHYIIDSLKDKSNIEVLARIRYRQALQSARLIKEDKNIFLVFDNPQKAVSPGQFAAIYLGEELVASAEIGD